MEDVIGRYMNIDSLNIYYETVGEGHPVVMIYLAGFDDMIYEPVIPYFQCKYKLMLTNTNLLRDSNGIKRFTNYLWYSYFCLLRLYH